MAERPGDIGLDQRLDRPARRRVSLGRIAILETVNGGGRPAIIAFEADFSNADGL